ncbi:hypothetical protein SADUNF_Sadunf16G0063700 [Salix dunnii]|uniref:Nudix hydrolase domain-containing protein n=1 Tax=Salix dunnii TaxID=1413687 RepID=A0A835J5D2_9ROSI|nr:hypothetical protein SADUNF_Sadunf16G0063700 [Salix dunnii]
MNKFASVALSGSSCAGAVSLTRSKRRSRRRESPPPMETPPDGHRRNAGICLVNPSKKLRTQKNELFATYLSGLVLILDVQAPHWLTHDFPSQARERINRRRGANYKGQAQKWFLFKFAGKEEEINLLGDGSGTPEFKDWAWLLPERLLELVVGSKKPVYEQVMKLFGPYLQADAEEGDSAGQNETMANEHASQLLCEV